MYSIWTSFFSAWVLLISQLMIKFSMKSLKLKIMSSCNNKSFHNLKSSKMNMVNHNNNHYSAQPGKLRLNLSNSFEQNRGNLLEQQVKDNAILVCPIITWQTSNQSQSTSKSKAKTSIKLWMVTFQELLFQWLHRYLIQATSQMVPQASVHLFPSWR